MDYNEAIAILEEQYRTASMCVSSSHCLKHNKAIKMAVEALKKQIPKKPIHVRTFKNLDLAFYKCPNCGFIRRKDLFPQYCEFCGQAIDRSEL